MLVSGIEIGEISNVRKSGDEDGVYFVDVEIGVQEGFPSEKMLFCARSNDYAMTGKHVYKQIMDQNFIGEITQLLPGADPVTGIVAESTASPTVTGAQQL